MHRQNYICNFRAPNNEYYQVWLDFKKSVQNHGLSICYVMLSLCQAWLKGIQGSATCRIQTPTKIINLQQQNTFVYSVQKPRRQLLTELNRSGNLYSRTIASRLFQAYITDKARELKRSFSFYDFQELDHNLFRKCILKLKNVKKVLPVEPRTNPRFYILPEWLPDYPTMKQYNVVKPWFTGSCIRRGE